MESSDSNESDRAEEQMSQNTNSNSASVIAAGPTGVTGSRVIKFGYKEFPKISFRLSSVHFAKNYFVHTGLLLFSLGLFRQCSL